MRRRNLISMLGVSVALAACGGGAKLPELPVSVAVTLPPQIQAIIDDATAIIGKVSPIAGAVPKIAAWVEAAKVYVDRLTSGVGDAKSTVGSLVSVLGLVAGMLPPPYGTIALAIETLLPVIGGMVGMRMAARRRTGMSPAQARRVLRG